MCASVTGLFIKRGKVGRVRVGHSAVGGWGWVAVAEGDVYGRSLQLSFAGNTTQAPGFVYQ